MFRHGANSRYSAAENILVCGLAPTAVLRWNAPIAKYASRCEQIASLTLGLMYTIMFYRIFALPVLLYLCQFSEPPDSSFNAECAALRKLVKGPGNWIPMKALWNLEQMFYLPVSFPQLKLMALAVRMRVSLTEAPDARQQWEDFQHCRRDEDLPLLHPLDPWFQASTVATLVQAQAQATSLGIDWSVLRERSQVMRNGKRHWSCIQRDSFRMLRATPGHREDLEPLIRNRLWRWTRRKLLRDPIGHLARRAVRVYADIQGEVPPCVVAALIRTHFNGWCTARRFQEPARGKCSLSEDCSGEDSIEHYACCQCTRDFARRRLRFPGELELQTFLGLDVMDSHARIRTALLVYAVYNVVNSLRSQQLRAQRGTADHLLRERLRYACMLHNGCDSFVRSLWSNVAHPRVATVMAPSAEALAGRARMRGAGSEETSLLTKRQRRQ
jgi:hypothetical protein